MSVIANGCWTAAENTRLYQSSTIDEKERTKLVKEGGAYSGIFKIDFLRNCSVLGIVPHPQVAGYKRMKTVADEERDLAQAEVDRIEAERRAKDPPPPVVEPEPVPVAASPPPSNAPASSSDKKGNSKTPAKNAKPVVEKLTPAQKAAAELAAAMAALSPDELKPITELSVRGWTLDVGTAAALQMTIPACKSLTTLRFWNANLSPRALTLISDAFKGSVLTKLFLDYNPLPVEKGSEPGLIYSVLLQPNSPLQYVSLRGNAIDDNTIAELARTLQGSKNLVVLDLFDNLIGDAGADALSKLFGLNQTLQSVNLGRNRISDSGAKALAEAFRSLTIADKEDAKNLKKAGFKITTVKNKTMREANQLIKQLNLSQNEIGTVGLKAWVEMAQEQIKYTPQKGFVTQPDGLEVLGTSLIPARLLPTPPVEETPVVDPSLVKSPSSRKTPRRMGGAGAAAGGEKSGEGTPSGSKPSSAAPTPAKKPVGAASGKAGEEDDDMRYPGQLNNLTMVNLSKQSCQISELLWWELNTVPFFKWTEPGSKEQWTEEGTLSVRSIDAARAVEAERLRKANQTDEERLAEEQAIAAAAAKQAEEAAAEAAAAAAALAEAKNKKKDRKKADA